MTSAPGYVSGMPTASAPITTIRPPKGWAPLDLREFAGAHELLYFLVLRNLKLRYKQTLLGAAWAVLQPLLAMAIFSVIFGRLARLGSDGLPYEVFALAALTPWTYFANAPHPGRQQPGGPAPAADQGLFPAHPASARRGAGRPRGPRDLARAAARGTRLVSASRPRRACSRRRSSSLLATAAAFAPGIWLAAFNVRYRDVRYVIPFLVQIWLFASPVAYSGSLVPERWRVIYGLNPMVGVVNGFRWMIAPAAPFPGMELAAATVTVAALLVAGLYVFRRMEQSFADVV